MTEIKRLNTGDVAFWSELKDLLAWEAVSDESVFQVVNDIIGTVRKQGDSALIEYTERFDQFAVESMSQLEMPLSRLARAYNDLEETQKSALDLAANRIRKYAEHQKLESWEYTEADGTVLGQQISPLDRAGLYVPGGKAAYPSSVLMNAIPAQVAGVKELIMVVPTPRGIVNELVLAAGYVAGVSRVFTIGGAQAIAALAYGTETVPPVDKIVGPGNIYVATAKRTVFGAVGIDMVAGPSEILVVCDGMTNPDWIAMDLFSQVFMNTTSLSVMLNRTQWSKQP